MTHTKQRILAPGPIAPPPEDYEYEAAMRLLRGNPLDVRILDAVVGQPRRYSELRPLLRGKADHNLTKGLERLTNLGALSQRSHAEAGRRTDVYALTSLGDAIRLAMAKLGSVHETAKIAQAYFARREATRSSA